VSHALILQTRTQSRGIYLHMWIALALSLAAPQLASQPDPAPGPQPASRIGPGVPTGVWVRPGYRLTVAADGLGMPRFLEQDDAGHLFVSRPYAPIKENQRRSTTGDIIRLADADRDGVFESRSTFLEGPTQLHGLSWQSKLHEAGVTDGRGWLWYTTSGSVHKARDSNDDGKADDLVTVLAQGSLPEGGANWWRSICVTRTGFYTSIGDSGNITDEAATERQKIYLFQLDGSAKSLFASGLRNTEKLRIRPDSDELWGIDHGSDWFGRAFGEDPANPAKGQPITDDNPPDEINLYTKGSFFGHPFIVGSRIPRPEFASKTDIVETALRSTPPEWSIPAHWAPNGFTFLAPSRDGKPAGILGNVSDMVVCCHGSWNRSSPVGYKVVRVMFDPYSARPCGNLLLVDALKDRSPLLRPVDAVESPDGSILFSCDMTGKIYRLSKEP